MDALRIGFVGEGPAAEARRESLRRLGIPFTLGSEGPVDVLFVASPPAERQAHVQAGVRKGRAVFAEWPPAPALTDVQALVSAADEAGALVCASRPLRFAPLIVAARPSRLVLLQRTLAAPPLLTASVLADMADLCRFLTASSVPIRLEAHAERDASRAPRAVAFTLRFQNGACAQVSLCAGTEDTLRVQAFAGATVHETHLVDADVTPRLLDAETRAFLDAVARRESSAVPPLDALQTLRLVEKIWARLR